MLEAGISLEGLAPKLVVKEYKNVAKAMKSKDDAVKQSALDRFMLDVRYLTEGGCLLPLLDAVAPKKKSLDFSKTALLAFLQFLEAKPAVDGAALPAVQGLRAVLESEGHLGHLQIVSDLLVYKDEVKKIKEVKVKVKKGEPVPEPVVIPPVQDSELSIELRATSLKAVSAVADALKFLPAYTEEQGLVACKRAFAQVPGLVANLCAVLLGFQGNPGGTDTPSVTSRLGCEDPTISAAAVQEGMFALNALVLALQFNATGQGLQVFLASGMLAELPVLAQNEALSLYCVQLVDVLSQDSSTGLPLAANAANVSVLLSVAETAAANAGSRVKIAEMATVVKTFTIFAQNAGHVFESSGDDADTVARLVTAVSALAQSSAVWEICRAADAAPFDLPLWEFVNSCCVLLGALGKVGSNVRRRMYAAGAASTLLLVLNQSKVICGTPVAPMTSTGPAPMPDADAEALKRVMSLRRVAEQALLFVLTEQKSASSSSSANNGIRWASPVARFSTDESLFSPESAVAAPSSALLDLIGAEGDDDLNNRGVRVVSMLLQSSEEPKALMELLQLGAAGAAKISGVVHARALKVLEQQQAQATAVAADSAPPLGEQTEGAENHHHHQQPQEEGGEAVERSALVVDVLTSNDSEALYNALSALEPLLLTSAEFVNTFCTAERLSALASLLSVTGPSALAQDKLAASEFSVLLFDPRVLPMTPAELDGALGCHAQLRPIVFDVLSIVAAADAKFRVFEGEVPPAAGEPLPANSSPSSEQALLVCKLCSNVTVATLLVVQQFVLVEDVVVSAAASSPLSVLVLDAALRLLSSMASAGLGHGGSLAALQAIADAGFSVPSRPSSSAADSAMFSLSVFLSQLSAAAPEVLEEGSEGEVAAVTVPGSVPDGFVYAAPATFADTVDYFNATTVPTASLKLVETPSLWPLVTLCAPLVAVLANRNNSPATASFAAAALRSITKVPQLADASQPVIVDALSCIFLSLGGGVALVGACGAFGNIPAEEKPQVEELALYLLGRGATREEHWAETDAVVAEDGTKTPGSDPSGGPGAQLWATLLKVVCDDLHGRSPRATVLTTAVQGLLPKVAIELIRHGADVNRPDGALLCPLVFALLLGMGDVVGALRERQCDLNATDAAGNPALLYAFLSLSTAQLASTFTGPCPVRAEDGEEAAAPIELLGGAPFVPLLVAGKVDLLVSDVGGNSPLLLALGLASCSVIVGGYNLSIKSSAYSSVGSCEDTLTTAALLLRAGAAVDFCSKRCLAPVHVACVRGHVEMIDLLLRSGAAPNVQDIEGFLPLHYAAAACPSRAIESLERLLKSSSDQPLLRLAFQDLRTGKSEEDKILIDIDAAFRDIFTAALDPLSIRTARVSAMSVFLMPADNGLNVLQLCLSAHQLQLDAFAPYLEGDKMQRMSLGVWLLKYAAQQANALLCNVQGQGSTALHSVALLLQGLTECRELTAAEMRSKRVKYFPSLELNLLDSIWAALPALGPGVVNAVSAQPAPGLPGLPAQWTALHAAIAQDNADLVKSLLAHGADVSLEGANYVHFLSAVNAGQAVADVLIAVAAASPLYASLLNSVAPSGNPECEIIARPLHIAARRGNAAALKALAACLKVDPNVVDEEKGTTAIYDIVERSDVSSLDALAASADRVDLLVETRGAGQTCVDIAVEAKDLAVLARLLSMRKNDVVERILLVRDNGESLLVAVERENMRLAIECGFGPAAAQLPQEEPGFEQSVPPADDAVISPQVVTEPESEPAATSAGMDAEAAEETKGEVQDDYEAVKKQVEVEGLLVSPLPEPEPQPELKAKIASAHDLRMLQESDEIVLLLLQAVSGLVGPDVHAHACYAEGSLWREYFCTAM